MAEAPVNKADYDSKWEGFWGRPGSVPPGECWDQGKPAQFVAEFMSTEEGIEHCKGKEVLVPGCGRGYDLVMFQQAGASRVVGLEISPTAVGVAAQYAASTAPGAPIEVKEGDFFATDAQAQFDLGYDYTFFCAIHPTMRADWGASWGRWLRPGGILLTLMFPIEPDGRMGPPWPVQYEAYEKALTAAGFQLVSKTDVPAEKSGGNRGGRECLGVWVKAASTDGPRL